MLGISLNFDFWISWLKRTNVASIIVTLDKCEKIELKFKQFMVIQIASGWHKPPSLCYKVLHASCWKHHHHQHKVKKDAGWP